MSDDFEDARVFLELCYFTVSLITDTMSPVQYFKSDFVVLMQPIIEKFVSQFPSPNERQILSNASYRRLVSTYVSKIRPLIDALKQSGLWVLQGTAPQSADTTDLINSVLNSETYDVEQLLILRSVRTNQLIYTPELTLYFNACLLCCQSPIVIVRLYAYSLLRSAPVIVDLRHLSIVLQHAVAIWQKGVVSFEFCAALFLLLTRFSEQRPSAQDENEYEKILQLIVDLHNSSNFETLMCFDPTLRWMFSCFPPELINRVSDTALPSLKENHSGDFIIICHCLALGIGDSSKFGEAVQAALSNVACWAHPIQKEARSSLATLPLSAPESVTPEVVDIIASVLNQPPQTSEPSLYIFAQFLCSYFLGTAAPLHLPLLKSLLNIMAASEGKKNLPIDIQNIVVAICSNPVRFLQVLKETSDNRQLLFSLLKQADSWEKSLVAALISPQTFCLTSDSQAKAAVKLIKEKALTVEEKDNFEFYNRLEINLPLLVTLYPIELRKLVEHLTVAADEDLYYIIIEIFCIVTLQGRTVNECKDMQQFLPTPAYKCEYSELTEIINTALAKEEKNSYETLSTHIDNSLSQFLTIGSASNTALSLLFEHVVWAEGDEVLVIFKRLKLKPALWFASAVASLFAALVSNPNVSLIKLFDERAKNSAEQLVWIGYVIFKRLLPFLRKAIVNEEFSSLPKLLFYPLIEFEVTSDEISLMQKLNSQYQSVLKDLFGVMVHK
ncbi:hypothetical protein TRFO_31902 [Tritrichomonas foetus]|uniref:Uncharacterized protein n=1 Tax=Tritrichomonas foetus TaxID=1144522 RepID=A0A1J4JQ74_9EUKA|nr:hypothetical protein TRFO_31902 [Tritrichomonas foetus]|eukprot:OHT01311.1 hypothetical protein TRFO_31902 [Tritrichomonas foetus]